VIRNGLYSTNHFEREQQNACLPRRNLTSCFTSGALKAVSGFAVAREVKCKRSETASGTKLLQAGVWRNLDMSMFYG
jgi:hypothetical protein